MLQTLIRHDPHWNTGTTTMRSVLFTPCVLLLALTLVGSPGCIDDTKIRVSFPGPAKIDLKGKQLIALGEFKGDGSAHLRSKLEEALISSADYTLVRMDERSLLDRRRPVTHHLRVRSTRSVTRQQRPKTGTTSRYPQSVGRTRGRSSRPASTGSLSNVKRTMFRTPFRITWSTGDRPDGMPASPRDPRRIHNDTILITGEMLSYRTEIDPMSKVRSKECNKKSDGKKEGDEEEKNAESKCVVTLSRTGHAHVAALFEVIEVLDQAKLWSGQVSCTREATTSKENRNGNEEPPERPDTDALLAACIEQVTHKFVAMTQPHTFEASFRFEIDDALPALEEGFKQCLRGEWHAAASFYEDLLGRLHRAPNTSKALIAKAHWNLAMVYQATQRFDEAEVEINNSRALVSSPEHAQELYLLKKRRRQVEQAFLQRTHPGPTESHQVASGSHEAPGESTSSSNQSTPSRQPVKMVDTVGPYRARRLNSLRLSLGLEGLVPGGRFGELPVTTPLTPDKVTSGVGLGVTLDYAITRRLDIGLMSHLWFLNSAPQPPMAAEDGGTDNESNTLSYEMFPLLLRAKYNVIDSPRKILYLHGSLGGYRGIWRTERADPTGTTMKLESGNQRGFLLGAGIGYQWRSLDLAAKHMRSNRGGITSLSVRYYWDVDALLKWGFRQLGG